MTTALPSRIAASSAEELLVLPVSLLDSEATRVEEFRNLSRRLRIPLGWHYLLDLAWASRQLEHLEPGSTVLDAGAGTGLMQWWLSNRGVNVISIDREPRFFSRTLRQWSPIVDFHDGKPISIRRDAARFFVDQKEKALKTPRVTIRMTEALLLGEPRTAGSGVVRILEGNLMKLDGIDDASVDAVVSISSLEHNSPENLRVVVAELKRIIKPGGKLVATLGADGTQDWFHEPSHGWCYTEGTFRDIFGIGDATSSNFGEYPDLFEDLRNCDFLRENLSGLYFKSDNNGMPWGRWDPKYMSAGVMQTMAA